MRALSLSGLFFITSLLPAQEFHLMQTLNYGKHVSDIVLSGKTPFPVQYYVYKLQPEEAVDEVVMESDVTISDGPDTVKKTPHVKPPPQAKYGFRQIQPKTDVTLGAGEFVIYNDAATLITEDEGDSIFRRFRVGDGKVQCADSLVFGKKQEGRTSIERTGTTFYLLHYSELRPGNRIDIYDSAFRKVSTLTTFQSQNRIAFADSDRFYVMEWASQATKFYITEYSVSKGKLNDFIMIMPAATGSFGEGIIPVNDTLLLVYAEMYSSRDTWVYALSRSGKIYWSNNLHDYVSDMSVLPGSGKVVCSYYNVQQQSTVRFYSLRTGKWEKTINMQLSIPEFALNNNWPVYLPLRQAPLPGGKWISWLVDCYCPSDRNKNSMYLMASNGVTTIKTKLRKGKSITSMLLVPLSKNKVVAVVDDEIYYYAIY